MRVVPVGWRFRPCLSRLAGPRGAARRLALLGLLVGCAAAAQAHIALTYPTAPQTFVPHQGVEIGWDIYIGHGPGTIRLEYSLDGGQNYTLIVDGIPYSGLPEDRFGSYLWSVPEVETADGRLRVLYTADAGGTFHNGQYGEADPTIAITSTPSLEIVLENGLDAYDGTRDTTIFAENTNSNGGGEHLFAGTTASPSARRALIGFDLSSIPDGAQIIAAELGLTVSKTNAGLSAQALHRLTQDWGEGTAKGPGEEGAGAPSQPGDATWVSARRQSADWATPGGDFVAQPSAVATAGAPGATAHWASAALIADVQHWVDQPSENFGWILIGDESQAGSAKRYYASENATAPEGQRPRLTLRYTLSSGIPVELSSFVLE
ncbi:MAG TPA: DNRLRE domain-containing protein [Candidatus Sumerlaeota bacterium]|nr:DNRLRE domain-containing protein [Candidatus Sumerlaeota bacterium]HOR28343.1 DNRLRE domain-containing protein [Candidatus Sumerlaeota bacterium]HPK03650.1 DNRLRE domain-containing protein [Candidatus Sumerlaeota bacterium]